MIRYRSLFLVHALFSLVSFIGVAVHRLAAIAAEPVMAVLRATPVAAVFAVLPRFKVIAFRVIGALKPVYRESYDTHGLSLSGGTS